MSKGSCMYCREGYGHLCECSSNNTVSISDKSKAIHALEQERYDLNNQANILAIDMLELHSKFNRDIRKLSNKQMNILNKQQALDDAIFKLLG